MLRCGSYPSWLQYDFEWRPDRHGEFFVAFTEGATVCSGDDTNGARRGLGRSPKQSSSNVYSAPYWPSHPVGCCGFPLFFAGGSSPSWRKVAEGRSHRPGPLKVDLQPFQSGSMIDVAHLLPYPLTSPQLLFGSPSARFLQQPILTLTFAFHYLPIQTVRSVRCFQRPYHPGYPSLAYLILSLFSRRIIPTRSIVFQLSHRLSSHNFSPATSIHSIVRSAANR